MNSVIEVEKSGDGTTNIYGKRDNRILCNSFTRTSENTGSSVRITLPLLTKSFSLSIACSTSNTLLSCFPMGSVQASSTAPIPLAAGASFKTDTALSNVTTYGFLGRHSIFISGWIPVGFADGLFGGIFGSVLTRAVMPFPLSKWQSFQCDRITQVLEASQRDYSYTALFSKRHIKDRIPIFLRRTATKISESTKSKLYIISGHSA